MRLSFGKRPEPEFKAGDRIVYTARRLPESEAPDDPWRRSLSGRHGAVEKQSGDSPTPSVYVVVLDDGPRIAAFLFELSREAGI